LSLVRMRARPKSQIFRFQSLLIRKLRLCGVWPGKTVNEGESGTERDERG